MSDFLREHSKWASQLLFFRYCGSRCLQCLDVWLRGTFLWSTELNNALNISLNVRFSLSSASAICRIRSLPARARANLALNRSRIARARRSVDRPFVPGVRDSGESGQPDSLAHSIFQFGERIFTDNFWASLVNFAFI
jgi:hypothetical protein